LKSINEKTIDLLNNAEVKENRNHLLPNIDDINLCKSPEFGTAKGTRVNSIPSGAVTSTESKRGLHVNSNM
jgi:hypothetical protein